MKRKPIIILVLLFLFFISNLNLMLAEEDISLGEALMEENGIPLSLLNIDEFETEIIKVTIDRHNNTHVTLGYKYNDILLDYKDTLHFSDRKIMGIYDTDDIILRSFFFPEKHKDILVEKGISKSVVFIDFDSLLIIPVVSKGEAKDIGDNIKKNWNRDVTEQYELRLEYWGGELRPKSLILVWAMRSTVSSAEIVVDAQTGEVLREFDGIYYNGGDGENPRIGFFQRIFNWFKSLFR